MNEKLRLEQIRKFWTDRALASGQSPAASWSDQSIIEMEIREVLKWLEEDDRVLDIGCANGFSTVQFASQKRINIRGVDYIPEMIEQARHRLSTLPYQLAGTAEFDVGDITTLSEPTDWYDKVITIRVLINLAEWKLQLKALEECARVLKPGGTLLLSEATLQGWSQLNRFRQEWGLPDIAMHPINEYLDREKLVEAASAYFHLVEVVNFSSTYYVGTRVLKPLLIQALGANIDVGNRDMEWNRWFSHLPSWGDYGVQTLFVFRKA